MWQFLSNLFDSPLGGASVSSNPSVSDKVRHIEAHLDNRCQFPSARQDPNLFNLVDWNLSSDGKMTGPIYLGSASSLTNPEFTDHLGAVLSIIDDRLPKAQVQEYLAPNTAHMYIALDDHPSENISKYFEQAAQFIKYHQDRGVPVLIHCMAGMSRSSTLAAYYLMKKYNINAITALDLLKKRRPIVRPNQGFIQHLVHQEKK